MSQASSHECAADQSRSLPPPSQRSSDDASPPARPKATLELLPNSPVGSLQDFKSATTGVAAKAMRNELNKLASAIEDPNYKKAFEAEMHSFFLLFNRYLQEKARNTELCARRTTSVL